MPSSNDPSVEAGRARAGEDEPLLGRPGDVSQTDEEPIVKNLITGTAPIAQLGGILLFGLVWGAIFTHKRILFSVHPLLNAAAIVLAIQAVLILQPTDTHSPTQKRVGTYYHASFWALALGAFYAGLIVIEVHKSKSGLQHFESPHAILGIIIYVLFFIQALAGVTARFFPSIYGSVDNAKSLYKYHRVSGYIILILTVVNVALAAETYYAGKILGLKLWASILGAVLVVVGVVPRIKKQKLNFSGR